MREHHQEGYWPREKLIAMDQQALRAMALAHWNIAPVELRKLYAKDAPKKPAPPTLATLPTPAVPPDFIALNDALPGLAGGREECMLIAKQIAMILLANAYGDEAAARAFDTIVESVKEAKARITPVIAMHALRTEPTVECLSAIFAVCTGGRGLRWSRKDLIRLISEEFQIGIHDMLSARRTRGVVFPRQAAMYLCKRFTPSSYPEIGKSFGGRDHTTVLHAVHKFERLIEERSIDCGDDPVIWAKAFLRIAPQVIHG